MRRNILVLLCITLLLALVLQSRKSLATDPARETAVAIDKISSQSGPQSILLQPVDPFTPGDQQRPFALNGADGASDFCQTATPVTFSNVPQGGVTPNIQEFTQSANDPILSCMWGNPDRPQGYRTAWYAFTPQTNGVVTIDTTTSNYDTVVGVFLPSDENTPCATLGIPIACNDDHTGFSSRVTLSVAANQTYYVVIASWSGSSSGTMNLNIFIEPNPIESAWISKGNHPNLQRSHMSSVAVNGNIYAIGGQTDYSIEAPQISNRVTRYTPFSNSTTAMAQIPGTGFTNHTTVYLDGKIYLPGGDSGLTDGFSTDHWVYSVAGNYWTTVADAPGVGWSQAVPRPNGEGYYLIGGIQSKPVFTDTAAVTNNVWLYLPDSNAWLDNPPEMTTPRYGHTAVVLGNRVCVVGGINAANELLSGGECLAPLSTWQPIASLNVPRYGADSVVAADGKWYVFGGLDASSQAVPSVEVYDPNNPSAGWRIMSVPYDLVDPDASVLLARAFPAGEVVNQHLYALGGNDTAAYFTTPLVQQLHLPTYKTFLPVVPNIGVVTFNDNFDAAWQIGFNYTYSFSFSDSYDYYDVYYFDLPVFAGVNVQLSGIPSGNDYDLYLFDDNKLLWGASENSGNLSESIPATLQAGRYYVMVQRVVGAAENSGYQLVVGR